MHVAGGAERIGQTPVELIAVHEKDDAARFADDMAFELAFGIIPAGKAGRTRAYFRNLY